MRKIFLSPHNDDETLFGAFTLMNEKPEVVVVYDSYIQPARGQVRCSATARRMETLDAMDVLGIPHTDVKFLGLRDDVEDKEAVNSLMKQYADCEVWAPCPEQGGNRLHNVVGEVAQHMIHRSHLTLYMTYTNLGKSIGRKFVSPNRPGDIQKKLRALACYQTQIEIPDCRPHFLRSQEEFYF